MSSSLPPTLPLSEARTTSASRTVLGLSWTTSASVCPASCDIHDAASNSPLCTERNQRHYDAPLEFKPSRWEDSNPDDVTAFSFGPRVCIGRKFATVEVIALLVLMIRDWRLEPLCKPSETKEEWKSRVMEGSLEMTLGIKPAAIRFVRR